MEDAIGEWSKALQFRDKETEIQKIPGSPPDQGNLKKISEKRNRQDWSPRSLGTSRLIYCGATTSNQLPSHKRSKRVFDSK